MHDWTAYVHYFLDAYCSRISRIVASFIAASCVEKTRPNASMTSNSEPLATSSPRSIRRITSMGTPAFSANFSCVNFFIFLLVRTVEANEDKALLRSGNSVGEGAREWIEIGHLPNKKCMNHSVPPY